MLGKCVLSYPKKSHLGGWEQKCVRCLTHRPITTRTDTKIFQNFPKCVNLYTEFICRSFTLRAGERMINSSLHDWWSLCGVMGLQHQQKTHIAWDSKRGFPILKMAATATIHYLCTRVYPFSGKNWKNLNLLSTHFGRFQGGLKHQHLPATKVPKGAFFHTRLCLARRDAPTDCLEPPFFWDSQAVSNLWPLRLRNITNFKHLQNTIV